MVTLFRMYSNLCDHNPPTLQTDRQTDDICDRNTALCTKMHRAVKMKDFHSRALNCDDFRGIAISLVRSKVFEYCFLERYQSLTSSENQFGFKKGLGCRNAIHELRSIVDG